MPHLNVDISTEAIDAAKEGALRSGMLLRRWVERAILKALKAEKSGPVEREEVNP